MVIKIYFNPVWLNFYPRPALVTFYKWGPVCYVLIFLNTYYVYVVSSPVVTGFYL